MTTLVTVPYWRTLGTVRRAVESVLAQSHRDLLLVVLNDGDQVSPPWPELDGISDPGLIRHDLPANRGRYFCDAVAAQAAHGLAPWWMPVDSDDWLSPGRLAALVAAADNPDTDAVMSGWTQHLPGAVAQPRRLRPPAPGRPIRAVAHLSSLWRPGFARALAHPGQRMAWDQIMTTAAWTYGRITTTSDAGYHRVVRDDSLMRSTVHGKGTPVRRAAKRYQRELWSRMCQEPDLARAAKVLATDVPAELAAEVERESTRLRKVLEETRWPYRSTSA